MHFSKSDLPGTIIRVLDPRFQNGTHFWKAEGQLYKIHAKSENRLRHDPTLKSQKIQQKLEAALSKGKAASAAATTTAAAGGELGDDQLKVKIQKLEAELDARNHEFEKKQV